LDDRPNLDRSRRATSVRRKTSQFDTLEAGGKGKIPEAGQDRCERLLDVRRDRLVPYEPEVGKLKRCAFTFEVANPQDEATTLRFVIEAWVPIAGELPAGSMLELWFPCPDEVCLAQ